MARETPAVYLPGLERAHGWRVYYFCGYRLVKKRPPSSRALHDEVLVGEVRRVSRKIIRFAGYARCGTRLDAPTGRLAVTRQPHQTSHKQQGQKEGKDEAQHGNDGLDHHVGLGGLGNRHTEAFLNKPEPRVIHPVQSH